MKLVALVLAAAPTAAHAEPSWRLDLSARGIASLELATSAMETREAIVPAVGARIERMVGGWYVGGMVGAGMPAYYGRSELGLSVDREYLLGDSAGARWAIATGVDVGLGLLYFDAPPETAASSNALIYWGPVTRARMQLHVLDVLPNTRAVGLVVGANAALTSARYMSTASGTGVRLEPELEVGLTMRL